MSRQVLIIEDDTDLATLIRLHLQDLGCAVTTVADGAAGVTAALERGPWSLVVLDLGLPHVDGLEICVRLRLSGSYTPILMLTARAAEHHRVLGLETGADDYLTKPFSVVEFGAREGDPAPGRATLGTFECTTPRPQDRRSAGQPRRASRAPGRPAHGSDREGIRPPRSPDAPSGAGLLAGATAG